MNARITTLPRNLKDYAAPDAAIPHVRQAYEGAVNGKYPAYQINGIWHYDLVNLPVIAAAYGLPPKDPSLRRSGCEDAATVSPGAGEARHALAEVSA